MVTTMWLPTTIYERLPQFFLLLGLLFMASAMYFGFDYEMSYAYFGVGVACCAWSLCIFALRLRNRNDDKTRDLSPQGTSPDT